MYSAISFNLDVRESIVFRGKIYRNEHFDCIATEIFNDMTARMCWRHKRSSLKDIRRGKASLKVVKPVGKV